MFTTQLLDSAYAGLLAATGVYQMAYVICLIVAGGMLVISTFLGGDSDVDGGFDADVDVDVEAGTHLDGAESALDDLTIRYADDPEVRTYHSLTVENNAFRPSGSQQCAHRQLLNRKLLRAAQHGESENRSFRRIDEKYPCRQPIVPGKRNRKRGRS